MNTTRVLIQRIAKSFCFRPADRRFDRNVKCPTGRASFWVKFPTVQSLTRVKCPGGGGDRRFWNSLVHKTLSTTHCCVSLFVARVNLESRVKFKSRVKFESGSKFFSFFSFFFDYTNDVRAVTRNINFSVGNTFDRSKEPLPLCIAVASPRHTTTFNIKCIF